MKKSISKISFSLSLSTVTVLSCMTPAIALTPSELKEGARDEGVKTYMNSKNNQEDYCILPPQFSLQNENQQTKFVKSPIMFSDRDRKREEKLCSLDLNTSPLCPKVGSTNPGVFVISHEDAPKGTDINYCKGREFGLEAKFKQSITCSYSGSALAAYHLSRILGNLFITPVVVARSMDKARHDELITQALEILDGRNSETIYKAWTQFNKASISNPLPHKIYLSNGQLYGALSENIKHEFNYTEVSGVGPYETRYSRFKQQGPFNLVKSEQSMSELSGSDLVTIESLPQLQQMIDVSNMVVLDSLLSQDDRIGNIHFLLSYATLNPDGSYSKTPVEKEYLKNIETRFKKRSLSRWSAKEIISETKNYVSFKSSDKNFNTKGILLREMVLKDNDCGVDVDKRANMMRQIGALEEVKHFSPITYKNILRLYSLVQAESAEVKNFFLKTLLYRESDYSKPNTVSFKNNLKYVANDLKARCKAGKLKLDLGLKLVGNEIHYTQENCDI